MILSRSGINIFYYPNIVMEDRVCKIRHGNPVGFPIPNIDEWGWCFWEIDDNMIVYEWVNVGRAIQIIKDELKGEIR